MSERGEIRRMRFKVITPVYKTMIVGELAERYTKQRFTSPEDIYEKFKHLSFETKENFYALHLDGKNKIICIDLVSLGSLNQAVVHPREVFKSALLSSAAAIVCIHNHPGGDSAPSREDMEITRRLKEAGELLGIKVLDHIIIGEKFFSFTEHGLL